MNKGILVKLLVIISLISFISGCASYRAIGAKSNGSSPMYGTVTGNLMDGSAKIDLKYIESEVVCSGTSKTTYIPNVWALDCKGQEGKGVLNCSDSSTLTFSWTSESCTSGKGYGYDDSDGERFSFVYGENDEEAAKQLIEIYEVQHSGGIEGLKKEISYFKNKIQVNSTEKYADALLQGLAVGAMLYLSVQPNSSSSYDMQKTLQNENFNSSNESWQSIVTPSNSPSSSKKSWSSLGSTNSNNCHSSTECGIGSQCVKKPNSTEGVCMSKVDRYGSQSYDVPNVDSTSFGKESCSFNTDCPVGFSCDSSYKVCIRN